VGIVGYPNVGKSSLINSLKRARAVNVGAKPGVTSTAQVVVLDSKVKLMDSPGIVFARSRNEQDEADVLLRNCVKVEKISDVMVPIEGILRRCTTEQLQNHFDIAEFSDTTEFLLLVGAKRGQLRKGGAIDQEATARSVLHEWNGGLIRYWSEPPKQQSITSLVGQLADEFDWNAAPLRVEPSELGEGVLAKQGNRHGEVIGDDRTCDTMAGQSPIGLGESTEHRRSGLLNELDAVPQPVAMDESDGQKAAGSSEHCSARLLDSYHQVSGPNARRRIKPSVLPRSKKGQLHTEADEKVNFQLNRVIRKKQQVNRKKKNRDVSRRMQWM